MKRILTTCLTLVLFTLAAPLVAAQGDGSLQIHFIDAGQGDAAVLISPNGETVLFDDGAAKNCDKPISYLQQLGINHIDFHINSHYHSDHLGCAAEIFGEFGIPTVAYDRGGTYESKLFTEYVNLVKGHRKTATAGEEITLDPKSANPVKIKIVALNGNRIPTSSENDLSVVSVITFGVFKAEFGGDLGGYDSGNYFQDGPSSDIETSVAPLVGMINVYKVHHHCSRNSTNETWLNTTSPQVGIVSVGDENQFGHPNADCLQRLHQYGVKTYWTETGKGGAPDPAFDTIAGNVIVEVAPNAAKYSVRSATSTVLFPVAIAPRPPRFAWSKKASVYHYANCKYVQNIWPDLLQTGSRPPAGKTLHKDCPK